MPWGSRPRSRCPAPLHRQLPAFEDAAPAQELGGWLRVRWPRAPGTPPVGWFRLCRACVEDCRPVECDTRVRFLNGPNGCRIEGGPTDTHGRRRAKPVQDSAALPASTSGRVHEEGVLITPLVAGESKTRHEALPAFLGFSGCSLARRSLSGGGGSRRGAFRSRLWRSSAVAFGPCRCPTACRRFRRTCGDSGSGRWRRWPRRGRGPAAFRAWAGAFVLSGIAGSEAR